MEEKVGATKTDNNKNKKLDIGHRERLRDFIIENYETVSKEKVFEYFMCLAIPRRDVRLLAKSILNSVGGSINALLNKDYNYLKNTLKLSKPAIGAIFTFKKMNSFCNKDELSDNDKFTSRKDIIRYFQREIGSRETEYAVVLFLNSAQKIVARRMFCEKNSFLTTFNTDEIILAALNSNARYIVFSHNHPSDDIRPSQADIDTTKEFINAIKGIKAFTLLDHIIVSGNNYYSFLDNKKLK